MRENLLSKGVLYWGFNTVLPVPWRNAFFLVSKNISHLMMYIPLFFIVYYFYRILEAILSTVPRSKWRIYVFHPVEGRLSVLLRKFYQYFFLFSFFSYLFYLFKFRIFYLFIFYCIQLKYFKFRVLFNFALKIVKKKTLFV